MAFYVKKIIDIEYSNNLKIVAGLNGLNNIVRNITIMDTPDIDKWIEMYELIIIGNCSKKNLSETFFTNLKKRNCAGIITKRKFLAYFNYFIPILNNLDLPLIVFPDNYSWTNVTTPIIYKIIQENSYDIMKYANFNEVIIKEVLSSSSYTKICDNISKKLDLNIAIISSSYELIDSSYNFKWNSIIDAVFSRKQLYNKSKINKENYYNFKIKNKSIFVFMLDNELFNKLIIVIENNNIADEAISLFELLALIIKLKYKLIYDNIKSNSKYNKSILVQLSSIKNLSKKNFFNLELLLGTTLEDSYSIASLKLKSSLSEINFQKSMTFTKFFKDNCKDYNKVLLFEEDKALTLLIPEKKYVLKDVILNSITLLKKYTNKDDFYIGISSFHDIRDLDIAFNEANIALNYSISKDNTFTFYKSMGFIRIFATSPYQNKNPYFQELIDIYICPLLNYDKKNKTDLFETLITFIKNNQSAKLTADELFIHSNTLRFRMKRIEQILDINLSESDDMLNVQLAIKAFNLKDIYQYD